MNLSSFTQKLNAAPETVEFSETMSVIDSLYHFSEAAFKNGKLSNAAGENNGSCKLFAFARRHGFSEQQTLACFGAYYRHDVLDDPEGDSHQNIRNFMKTGWAGIHFDGEALLEK